MNLFHREFGEGNPLLILHGLFGSSDNWQTLAKKFANEFRVYAIDLRNHGRSFHHEDLDYEVMTADLSEFIKENDLSQVSLLGHSMGGKLSMNFALKYPDKVKDLIVVDIAPRRYEVLHDGIIQALKSLQLDLYSRREEVDEALSQILQNFSIRQFLLKNLVRNNNHTFDWKINLKAIDQNIHNLVVEISADQPFQGNTLFIAGEKSDYIRPVDEEQIFELFPQAEVKYLPKVGHWVHAEDPDLLYNTIIAFTHSH
jgi:pimeloyl-ACP methyl ester carboxylesterase